MIPVTLSDIELARQRIGPHIQRTPLSVSHTLSARLRTNVYLKYELLQKTGSFKVRGAFNKALSVGPEGRGRGFVAVSGGNHAQAVAYVAAKLGVAATIVMPGSTPRNYVDATRMGPRWSSPATLRKLSIASHCMKDRAGSLFIPSTIPW